MNTYFPSSNILQTINTYQRDMEKVSRQLVTGRSVNSAADNPHNFFNSRQINQHIQDLTQNVEGMLAGIRTIQYAESLIQSKIDLLNQADAIVQELKSLPYSFSPDYIDGAILWLDSADESTILDADGDAASSGASFSGDVATWIDKTGQGNDAFDTSAVKPTYDATGINNLGSINFNGNSHFDTELGINAHDIPNQTIFSVYTSNVENNPGSPWGEDNGGYDKFLLDANDTSFQENIAWGGGFHRDNNLFDGTNTMVTTVSYQEDVADGSSVFVNGVSSSTFTSNFAAAPNRSPDTSNSLEIGALGRNNFQYDGSVTEMIIYDRALSAAEREDVEAYLMGKWQGTDGATPIDTDSAQFEQLLDDYQKVMAQIDSLENDVGYDGVNLLNNDTLSVSFGTDHSSALLIDGIDGSLSGLGITKPSISNAYNIDEVEAEIEAAIKTLENAGRENQTHYNAIQTRIEFAENSINNHQMGFDDLTLTDIDKKAAELLALQTKQQIALQSLQLGHRSRSSILTVLA